MEVKEIYLSWRKGSGFNRHIIGKFKRNFADGLSFSYISDNCVKAKAEGFICYPEFQDLKKTYKDPEDNILEIISTRIINAERTDKDRYLSFWEANYEIYDNFDKLAFTQGWLPTDQFEFLGVFYPRKGFSFVTDIAGISYNFNNSAQLNIGDNLKFELQPDLPYDDKAVKILTESYELIGYVKKGHNRFFYNLNGFQPILSIKAIRRNGKLKDVFVKVSV